MKRYFCWIEDYDQEGDWNSVGEYFDPETAAEVAAERHDHEGGEGPSDKVIVHVKDEDGNESVFEVTTEVDYVYHADRILPKDQK